MLASVSEKVSLDLVSSGFRKVCKDHAGRPHKLAALMTYFRGALVGGH